MDAIIRAMRAEDIADIYEIVSQPTFLYWTLALPYESFEAVKRWLEATSPRDLMLVAEVDGRVVGASALRPFLGRRSHAAEFWIGVREEHAGKGLGSQLLAAMIDTADNWLNLSRLEMTVFTDNERAIALYKKFGFEIEGAHKAATFRDGAFVDAYTMARLR
ncbi:GNAT family N-acetyltransferase [Methylopila turkensis]|uniref:GCN5 family acetyltransferase n=1 Tax=Methylopila turkensis TaxID=1437816 RepID=A0A9W6JLE9_9HYPH|nr:GNAT family N-acetyltransferase [Methylopila turkensis]GLK79337.1 GCN5 family acetyltransferase [Methylopila turkensis]